MYGTMAKVFKKRGNQFFADLDLSHSLHMLSVYDIPIRYVSATKDENGNPKLMSLVSSQMVDLRLQYIPYCSKTHGHTDSPTKNYIVGLNENSKSKQDYIYQWHFAHRHGFKTDIDGSGRGMSHRVHDILNHPISYILLCHVAHEEYDKETGEWKAPHKTK